MGSKVSEWLDGFVVQDMHSLPREAMEESIQEALGRFEGRFPLLERAAQNVVKATKTVHEWGMMNRNPCQIVRTPYSATATAAAVGIDRKGMAENMLANHLGAIEHVLEHGVPSIRTEFRVRKIQHGFLVMGSYTIQTAGGWRFFLGDSLLDGDTLSLALLRGPTLMVNRQAMDVDGWIDEWLTEFTLQVDPAKER